MKNLILTIVFGIFHIMNGLCQNPTRFQSEINNFKADQRDYSQVNDLVLFTGSSSMRMWVDLSRDFPQLNLLNRGFGGSAMSDLLYYADTIIIQCRPEKIFIYEGDNDIASGKRPVEIVQEAHRLVELIRRQLPGTMVCFISVKPSLSRWALKDTYCEFNNLLARFAGPLPGVYYLDVWGLMLGPDGKPRNDIYLDDGLHMNRKGYDLWKEAVGEFLESH